MSNMRMQASPVFTFANQAGLDMLETTLVALQDIMLDKILDEAGRKILLSEFSKIMQQVTLSLPVLEFHNFRQLQSYYKSIILCIFSLLLWEIKNQLIEKTRLCICMLALSVALEFYSSHLQVPHTGTFKKSKRSIIKFCVSN